MSASCPLCVRLGPARRVRFISPLRPVWLFLELVLFQFLKVEQRDVRARRAADQLVQLDLQGLRIAVLGILNEEYHEKGGNGGTGVKGCPTPALKRRRVRVQRCSAGRRWTSLEGGNRGEHRCGPPKTLWGFERPHLDECVNEAEQSTVEIAQVPVTGVDTPEFSATRQPENDVIAA